MGRPNFGHIERRGNNIYRVWWGKGRNPDGKRDRHSKVIYGTRNDAEIFLARQIGFGERPTSSITWAEFWAVAVEPTFEGLAARTVNDYQTYWNKHLVPKIGTKSVKDTDELVVDTVLATINSPVTQRHVKDLWRKACRIAVRRKLLPYCPIDSQTQLKPLRAYPKQLLDASEVMCWMDGIRGSKAELALLVMLGGGLRPEEAYGLHHEDIEKWNEYAVVQVRRALTYSHGKILKDTKNGFSTREVIIGNPFSERILALSQTSASQSSVILPSGRYDPDNPAEAYTSPSTACNNYRGWCKRHNVAYVAPKNLRSSYATMHGEAGSPDSLVSGSMGHSDGTTKGNHYQAITRRGLAMIADNLAEYLAQFTVEN